MHIKRFLIELVGHSECFVWKYDLMCVCTFLYHAQFNFNLCFILQPQSPILQV